MIQPTFLVIDLFCGFGGTTLGFSKARINGEAAARVLACVNHDPKAINSHYLNHPDVHHFTEDIRTLELSPLVEIVRKARIQYPDAYLVLWASLECTNHSKAKGGLPRDADSRTLACDLFRYQEALQPDYIMIENVVEFMAWGPLRIKCIQKHADRSDLSFFYNKKNKCWQYGMEPESRKNGRDWVRWRNQMNQLGYYDEWKELNSANFGAYTSRNRLFGAFAKKGLPIVWPEATHSKKVFPGMFGSLQPWKAVKDVLDFSDQGHSIFNRETNLKLRKKDRKPLVEKTLERIYAGMIKYVAGGKDAFIANYKSGDPFSKVSSTENPIGTLTCSPTQSVIQTHFMYKYYGNGHNLQSVEEPAGTVTTKDRFVSVGASFLDKQYGSGSMNHQSTEEPAGTLTQNPKLALVQGHFLDRQFSSGTRHQSVDEPHGAITTVPKSSLVTTFLVNRQYASGGSSTEAPSPTIIASQDKLPLYLVQLASGEIGIEVYETDSPMTRKIKEFMALYGIADIRMRMLKVPELLRIQGFPDTYQMVGNQSDHKKFIGNSVEPNTVKAWVEAMAKRLSTFDLKVWRNTYQQFKKAA